MNILWLSWKDITNPTAGGAEIVGELHARAWVNAGHSVHWVSLNYKDSQRFITKNGIEYEHIGRPWMWYLGLIHLVYWFQWSTNWHKRFDMVVDEIHGPPLLTPLYVRKPILTVIHEVAGEIWKKTVPFPLSWIMQYCVEPIFFYAYRNVPFMTVAPSTVEDLVKMRIPLKNISLIISGVNAPEKIIKYPKEKAPTIIFLSQIRPMKGIDRVYKAFKKLKSKLPDIELWVVGDDTLPYGQQFKRQVLKEQEGKKVTFFGKVTPDKKFELLSRAHILVHGSYKEGWGLVVIEANTVGTPAVVFDAAELRDSVKDHETGYLAKNQEEFVNYLENVLTNSQLYHTLQVNALQWSKQFSWDAATEKSKTLLLKLQ